MLDREERVEGGGVLGMFENRITFTPRFYPFEGYYKILVRPINREMKRKFMFETNDIIMRLYKVEYDFIYYLFTNDDDSEFHGMDYMDVYLIVCERYENMVDWINKNSKPKCVELKRDYFREEYKSLK